MWGLVDFTTSFFNNWVYLCRHHYLKAVDALEMYNASLSSEAQPFRAGSWQAGYLNLIPEWFHSVKSLLSTTELLQNQLEIYMPSAHPKEPGSDSLTRIFSYWEGETEVWWVKVPLYRQGQLQMHDPPASISLVTRLQVYSTHQALYIHFLSSLENSGVYFWIIIHLDVVCHNLFLNS